MKVSEFIRQYQISGQVPTPDDSMVAFWGGYLIFAAYRDGRLRTMEQSIEMAIKAAEFIEEHAK